MKKDDLESLFIDYHENKLLPAERVAFEETLNSFEDLKDSYNQYTKIIDVLLVISKEDYQASPGFRYRVMEAIEREQNQSIWFKLNAFLAVYQNNIYKIITATSLALLVVALNKDYIAFYLKKTTPSIIEETIPTDLDKFPIIERKTAPQMIAKFISDKNTVKKAPAPKSLKESAIENLLNAIENTFPASNKSPLGISYELVKSPLDHKKLILRTTLTVNAFEKEFGVVVEDIKINYVLQEESITAIEPLGTESERIENPRGIILWATGEQMVVDQQFTTLAVITLDKELNKNIDTNKKLLEAIINYIDLEQDGKKETLRIPYYFKDIVTKLEKGSVSLRNAFWMLFKKEMDPMAFEHINPQAYGKMQEQLEKHFRKHSSTLQNPNPENLKQFKEDIEKFAQGVSKLGLIDKSKINPYDRKIKIPDYMFEKYSRSQLRRMFPNGVDENGNPF